MAFSGPCPLVAEFKLGSSSPGGGVLGKIGGKGESLKGSLSVDKGHGRRSRMLAIIVGDRHSQAQSLVRHLSAIGEA